MVIDALSQVIACLEAPSQHLDQCWFMIKMFCGIHIRTISQEVISSMSSMMASSNGNIFRVTGPLCGEFTGHRWIQPHKGQWRGALMFYLICVWIYGWINNREAGDLRRYRAQYDDIVMIEFTAKSSRNQWVKIEANKTPWRANLFFYVPSSVNGFYKWDNKIIFLKQTIDSNDQLNFW